MRILLLTLVLSITALAATMSNADVVRMARRGASVREIVDKINQSESRFSLYPEDMKAMREDGVPEIVIRAMITRQTGEKFELPVAPASQPAGTVPPSPGNNETVKVTTASQVEPPIPTLAPAQPTTNALLPKITEPAQNGVTPSSRYPLVDSSYGFQPGSIAADGSAGFMYSSGLSGVHPNFGGGLSVGVYKYLGIFAQGGYSPLLNQAFCYGGCAAASAHLTYFAGGLEVVGTNRTRFVPYGRVGAGYGRGAASVSADSITISGSLGSAAIAFGGGLRAYVTRHFGIAAGVQVLHFVGPYGGGTVLMPTAGVFVQSK